jgi:hypothetical protein
MRSRRADVGAWLAVGVIALVPLQSLGLTPVRGHDTFAHYFRLAEVEALWRQGIWLSRWSPDLMFGYGYPLFTFYAPSSTVALAALARAAGGNAIVAQAAMYGALLLAAAVATFLLARRLYGAPGAVVAAAAYAWSPYLLYQTFERGSLSNAMAMGLAPLAALSLVHAARGGEPRRAALAALTVGAFLLSHPAAGALVLPGLALIAGIAVLDADRPRRGRWAVLAALAGGVALAACAWLPAVLEIQHTQYRRLMAGIDYRRHFAALWSWPGTVVAEATNPPLPITVGITQLASGLAGLALGSARMCRRRRAWRAWPAADYLAPLGAALGLALAVLATPASAPLWARVAPLRDLQFPWRWLDGGCLLLALSTGWLVDTAFRSPSRRQVITAIGLIAMFANAAPYLYPPRTHVLPARPTLADVSTAQSRNDIDGLTSAGEYRPAGVGWRPRTPPFPGADQGATLARKRRRDPPGAAVSELASGPLHADLIVDATAPVALVFETFYFRGWDATIDGRRLPARADASGLLAVDVPEGHHRVGVAFERTGLRALADTVSALTMIACAVGLLAGGPGRTEARARPLVRALPRRGELPILAVLVALAATKIVWLDAHDSPLVRHVRSDALAGTHRPLWREFGGELQLVGYGHEPPRTLTLYWRAARAPSRPYVIDLTFTRGDGAIAGALRQPNPGVSWTSHWEAGQLVRDVYRTPDLGDYGAAILSVRDGETGMPVPLEDSPDGRAIATTLPLGAAPPERAITPPARR